MELNPAGLNQLYNLPVEAVPSAMRLEQQLAGANELSNRKAQLANMFAEENNPVLVEQNRLENQAKQARLPGIFAESETAQLNAGRQRASQEDAIKAAQRKFAKEASDHDLSMLENRAQEMAYSQDPKMREQGMNILRMHRDMIKQRELTADQYRKAIDLENVRGANQRSLANINNEAGRYKKVGGAGGAGSTIEEQLASGKLSFEKAATLLAGAAFMAEQEGDDETADRYRAMADDYNSKHIASKRAGAYGAAETKPDLTPLGIKPNAPIPAEKFKKKEAPVPAGLKDNGDGTFTMPDGRIVRRKQQ